ncbi:histidine kinase [Sphingobacterium shayense]|uniref:histidine kinase n=1 Tax=Sphingobacterium shayense TaxID=626343 RepID=UPI0015523FCC|nr:histidine kinase [Sphingobacterium shayense]NQD69976.1 histidine kinase [Sphingobacterium shayense]
MFMNLTKITSWNTLSFFVFAGVFWLINTKIPSVIIPINQIIAISFLFALLYCSFFICWWWISAKSPYVRVAGFSSLIVMVGLIFGFSYPLIYDLLPKLGVVFHDPSHKFNVSEFQTRILTATTFIVILGAVMAFLLRYKLNKALLHKAEQKGKELQRTIAEIQQRVKSKHLTPHFIANVITGTMGLLGKRNHEKYIERLLDLSSLMHYAIEMQEEDKVVTWEEEWEKVMQLVELTKLCFGTASVICEYRFAAPQVELPIGILLMPIENALKYGSISENAPLLLTVEQWDDRWFFSVQNKYLFAKRNSIASSKTGYVIMQRRIDRGNLQIVLDSADGGDQFVATISGRCST